MRLTFLGTGPKNVVPENKNGRTNSSLYVKGENYSFIIDCSDNFMDHMKREGIKKFDFILQTHAHSDAMGGIASQLKKWMRNNNITDKMPLYCEEECWNKIKERVKERDYIKPKFITAGRDFRPGDKLNVVPFRLKHSIQEGFPTVGFRFDNIVYSEDVGKIPEYSEKYYKNADIIIFDAAMWFEDQIKGHHNVEGALEKAKKFHPKKFVLTQAGHTYPPQDEAEEKIQEYWEDNKGRVDTDILLAYDGMSLPLSSKKSRINPLRVASKYLLQL